MAKYYQIDYLFMKNIFQVPGDEKHYFQNII